MSAPAPRVYLITDRHETGDRPLDVVVGQAVRAVADTGLPPWGLAVQLREKDLGGGALLDHARRLRAVTAAAGVRLFVNDRVDVALAAGADGVHLGEGALTPADVRAIAPALQIALSTHTVDQVTEAVSQGLASFAVFGPVFDTPSKRSFGPAQGLERLRAAVSAAAGGTGSRPLPLLAIGGIDIANVSACRGVGAYGIACIRAVLRNSSPKTSISAFFEAIEST